MQRCASPRFSRSPCLLRPSCVVASVPPALSPAGAAHDVSPLAVTVRRASSSAELRAAASVRACAFFSYPADRSPTAIAAHQRLRVDAAWEALEAKTAGRDAAYKGVRVTALIATRPRWEDAPEVALRRGLDGTCSLPAGSDEFVGSVVLASLDLNRAPRLPSEELCTTVGDADKRAWLSNVATAPGARRRGLARALVRASVREALADGATHLFVHCLTSNTAARELYSACGFEVDAEEAPLWAAKLNRPARLLFAMELDHVQL